VGKIFGKTIHQALIFRPCRPDSCLKFRLKMVEFADHFEGQWRPGRVAAMHPRVRISAALRAASFSPRQSRGPGPGRARKLDKKFRNF
jgi:hypothetical protein